MTKVNFYNKINLVQKTVQNKVSTIFIGLILTPLLFWGYKKLIIRTKNRKIIRKYGLNQWKFFLGMFNGKKKDKKN